jgi:UDP-perosamine 4-acetyltransferase
MHDVIGLGAGGHARVLIDILQSQREFRVAGLLDACTEKKGTKVFGVPVLGDDSLLPELFSRGIRHAFVGVGSIGQCTRRREIYDRATSFGFSLISIIHPNASVSSFAKTGTGITIMAGAVINAGAILGDNVLVNTGAIVEHDCVIEDHAHIATGACLAGTVKVGVGSHIGAGAVVRQDISVGSNSIVGAGSVVVKNVADNAIVFGIPAKFFRKNTF